MPIDRNNAQYITGAIYKPTQTSAPGVWDLDDQANNVSKNLWPLPPQAIQRSLRFNSADTTSLNWTPSSAGNQYTFTTSMWVKRSSLGSTQFVAAYYEYCHFGFDTDETMYGNLRGTGGTNYFWISSAKFRDLSAWYHLVFAVDTANATSTNRFKFYVNGVEQTFSTISYPPQNLAQVTASIRYLGRYSSSPYLFNGYMAEVNFVDGQALVPTNFGETDPQTGVWIPKRYTGTYGTNGFRLSFANNSSTTALGYDSSGQGNNWTPNNFSVTPGVNNDSLLDVPSLYGTDTGLGGEVLGNYATLNPLQNNANGQTLSDGNLQVTMAAATDQWRTNKSGTVLPRGKWYFEATLLTMAAGSNAAIGIGYINVNQSGDTYIGKYANQGGSGIEFGAQGNTIGAAIDLETGRADYYKNGILTASFTSLDLTQTYEVLYAVAQPPNKVIAFNFGQRPFTYAAPAGYKALCTTNLPAPAIGQTSSNQADNHFDVLTYVGNGSARSITGLSFQPDLVWIKQRTGATTAHSIQDSVRGVDKHITSNGTDIEANSAAYGGGVTAFNANGFSIGTWGAVNENTQSYVAWCWKAGNGTSTNNNGTITSTVSVNSTTGFSIVSYLGTGSNGTTGHGLATTPNLIIWKARDDAYNWDIYHSSLGYTASLIFTTAATRNVLHTAPTSTTIPVTHAYTGGSANGKRMIAYCWAAVPGYSAFGSYTGNGSADGPFVYTGFRPKWVLVKSTSAVGDWALLDTTRDVYNLSQTVLYPNATYVEDTANVKLDIVSNGFKFRSTIGNGSGTTYVYMAFAETPARLSTAR